MSNKDEYGSKPTVETVVIASSGTTSTALPLSGTTPVVVQIPATFTGTSVTFEGSIDGNSTYGAIANSAGLITYAASANRRLSLDPAFFVGYDSIKVVSGSAEGSERTLKVKVYPV